MANTSGRHSRFPAVDRSGRTSTSKPASTPEVEPEAEAVADATPDFTAMTVDEIVAWVGDDAARKEAALEGEAAGRGRTSLASRLGD